MEGPGITEELATLLRDRDRLTLAQVRIYRRLRVERGLMDAQGAMHHAHSPEERQTAAAQLAHEQAGIAAIDAIIAEREEHQG